MALTVAYINSAKPGRHSDGRGLSLLVKPSGSKSWTLRMQQGGKRRDYGLGPYPDLSLAKARQKAAEWRQQLQQGIDPRAAKTGPNSKSALFYDVAYRCFESRRESWKNPKHADQWINTLEAYAFPKLGQLPVDQVSPANIIDTLRPIWLAKAETARRLKQRITAVLDFAYAEGLRENEAPSRAIALGLPKQPKRNGHWKAMPYSAVPAFYQRIAKQPETISRLALMFTILTAVRTSETRFTRWEEIDLTDRVWTIPGERMKAGETHMVPLSSQAAELLRALEAHKGDFEESYVFPGERKPYISDGTMRKMLKENDPSGSTVHGFRSSFRDWAAEQAAVRRDVSETALAHIPADKVEAAYRRTKFLDLRRPLMQDWADFVAR
ncbi:integrase arm-type DNA-binding domain-containing protein [Sphingorhabdus sp. Alg239-R122]|uniref:tyrosine-type recombinase/integrase n=1 Tax=Sphingorhabdus sp. Alg239-R122 TaxID=2305989 RepID=UPI0013DA2D14|nr:integrase arm-type DNA-binding domain-containing protein [Sphingorhabdus sp. Alg239-R122]